MSEHSRNVNRRGLPREPSERSPERDKFRTTLRLWVHEDLTDPWYAATFFSWVAFLVYYLLTVSHIIACA